MAGRDRGAMHNAPFVTIPYTHVHVFPNVCTNFDVVISLHFPCLLGPVFGNMVLLLLLLLLLFLTPLPQEKKRQAKDGII